MQTTNQLVREFEKVLGTLPKTPRLKRHEQAKVPVFDRAGKVVATIAKQCTSIGAARAVGARACEWSARRGGWIVKE